MYIIIRSSAVLDIEFPLNIFIKFANEIIIHLSDFQKY